MRTALRSLASDSWVLGIAAAAALAYGTVRLAEATIAFALRFAEGPLVSQYEDLAEGFFDPPLTFVAGGRYVYYGDLVQAAVLFTIVILTVTVVVHVTRPREESDAG